MGTQPILISYHADELRSVERGYGVSESGATYSKPEDYLIASKHFCERINQIAALTVVVQRPRDGRASSLRN